MTDHDLRENSALKHAVLSFCFFNLCSVPGLPLSCLSHNTLLEHEDKTRLQDTRMGCKTPERSTLISRLRMDETKLFTKSVELLKAVMGSSAPAL